MTILFILGIFLTALTPSIFMWGYFLRGRNWNDYFNDPDIPQGTFKNRVFWALVVGLPTFAHLVLMDGLPWEHSGLVAVIETLFAYAANAWIGHSSHQGAYVYNVPRPKDGQWTEWPSFWLPFVMTRSRDNISWYNGIGLSCCGIAFLVVLAAPLAVLIDPLWWWLPASFPLYPAAYWWGWKRTGDGILADPLMPSEKAWGLLLGLVYTGFLIAT